MEPRSIPRLFRWDWNPKNPFRSGGVWILRVIHISYPAEKANSEFSVNVRINLPEIDIKNSLRIHLYVPKEGMEPRSIPRLFRWDWNPKNPFRSGGVWILRVIHISYPAEKANSEFSVNVRINLPEIDIKNSLRIHLYVPKEGMEPRSIPRLFRWDWNPKNPFRSGGVWILRVIHISYPAEKANSEFSVNVRINLPEIDI